MQIVRRPRQLTSLASMMLFSIPFFVLNVWVLQKGSVAKVFHGEKLIWMGVQALWAFLTIRWLLKAKWVGFWSFCLMGAVQLGGNIYFLVRLKNYALAFYALFLLIVSVLYFIYVFRTLKEAYYDSGKRWFEGYPRFLPRIEAELQGGESAIPIRLSRLGFEGCYVYAIDAGVGVDACKQASSIQLKLGDLSLNSAVELVTSSDDGKGHGLKFVANSADQTKDIRDFIDRVRSAGYVS